MHFSELFNMLNPVKVVFTQIYELTSKLYFRRGYRWLYHFVQPVIQASSIYQKKILNNVDWLKAWYGFSSACVRAQMCGDRVSWPLNWIIIVVIIFD